jgi:hypothetical protein
MVSDELQGEDGQSEHDLRNSIAELNRALNDLASSADGEMPRIQLGPRGVRWAQSIEASRVMEMVAGLPAQMRDERLPDIVRLACLEAFLVHVRSMVEFFGVRRPNSRDFTAKSLVPDWKPPVDAEMERLNGYWATASQQVMHFSNFRTLQPDGAWLMLTPEDPIVDAMSDDLLTVWDRFATALDDPQIAPSRSNLRRFFP